MKEDLKSVNFEEIKEKHKNLNKELGNCYLSTLDTF